MSRLKWIPLLLAASCAAVLCGCGTPDTPAAPSSTVNTAANPRSGSANDLEGANAELGRGGAQVVHAPPADGKIPAGGLVITPPNPNDKMYQPGPGISGGN